MKITTLIIFILIQFSAFANLSDNLELFNKANNHYSKAEYVEALDMYLKIENAGYNSADLYYNIANTYYRTNKITNAVLYYERARMLSPDDDAVNRNLEMAKLQVYDKMIPVPEFGLISWYRQIRELNSPDNWAFISVFSFILLLLVSFFYLFTRNKKIKIVSFFIALLVVSLSLSSFIFAKTGYKELISNNKAIVVSPVCSIKSSPDNNSTELFIIHEGLKVSISDNSGDWYEVVFEDGRVGWLKKDSIVVI